MRTYVSLLALLTLLLPALGHGHTHLEKSEPAKEASLETPPTEVTLHFSGELETKLSNIEVKNMETGNIVSQGKVSDAGQGKTTLQIHLAPLDASKDAGKYQVSWKATSVDTHKLKGSFEFSIAPKH